MRRPAPPLVWTLLTVLANPQHPPSQAHPWQANALCLEDVQHNDGDDAQDHQQHQPHDQPGWVGGRRGRREQGESRAATAFQKCRSPNSFRLSASCSAAPSRLPPACPAAATSALPSLVGHHAARHVAQDLSRLLHGEVDLIQVVNHLRSEQNRAVLQWIKIQRMRSSETV